VKKINATEPAVSASKGSGKGKKAFKKRTEKGAKSASWGIVHHDAKKEGAPRNSAHRAVCAGDTFSTIKGKGGCEVMIVRSTERVYDSEVSTTRQKREKKTERDLSLRKRKKKVSGGPRNLTL